MRWAFLVIFLLWGWAEMTAFIFIGSEIGGLLTLLGVFVTAVIGIALLRQQGLSVLNNIRNDLAKGQAPVTSIADSIALLGGGILMLIPGYVTDAIGLLLFVPGLRTLAGIYILQWIARNQGFTSSMSFRAGGNFSAEDNFGAGEADNFKSAPKTFGDDDIIEGEFEEHGDHDQHIKKPISTKDKEPK